MYSDFFDPPDDDKRDMGNMHEGIEINSEDDRTGVSDEECSDKDGDDKTDDNDTAATADDDDNDNAATAVADNDDDDDDDDNDNDAKQPPAKKAKHKLLTNE